MSQLAFNLPVQVGVAFLLGVSLLSLLQYFRPIDRRWTFIRKKWHLPPGPRGQFVVGNLVQMFEARETGKLAQYVSLITTIASVTKN